MEDWSASLSSTWVECTHWHRQMDLDADATDARRYYPPEFWDQKNFNDKQNLNSFRGEGWRNRGAQVNSKLLTQGRDVIRFETPFDIVCLGCQEVIHKGVRFNADKRKVRAPMDVCPVAHT